MVKDKTIFKKQMEKSPAEVSKNLQKLNFVYNAQINQIIAKTCKGKTGNEFSRCMKKHAGIAGDIYSLKDFYSDNSYKSPSDSLSTSIKILKKIFSENNSQ